VTRGAPAHRLRVPHAGTTEQVPGGYQRMVCDKVRIRFQKAGDLRLVSHHDLLRCFERMLRRADLPFHSTQGFNPRPRLVFALSLPLGIVGCQEVVELELDAEVPPEQIHARLAQQAPPGLQILSVQRVDRKAGAQVRRVTYRLALPPQQSKALSERAAALLAAPECWVERTRTAVRRNQQQPPDMPSPDTPAKDRSQHNAQPARRLNVRPYLCDLRVLPDYLEMDLWVTPNGTARPDEVVALLGLSNLLAAGAVLERTRLEVQDETEEFRVQGSGFRVQGPVVSSGTTSQALGL